MKPESRSALPWLAALVWWLVAAGAVASENGLLEGELGRWVDGVAPKLGETLSRHPRFKGETIGLAPVTPGLANGGSRLSEAVARRLRQRLLEVEGLRLAAARPRRDCEPPQSVDYLVRIEVADAGGRDGRVHIAVVDVAESLWVSGISYQWHGRLSTPERASLAVPVSLASPGAAGSPIPLSDTAGVAAAIEAELACTLPRDLTGAVFVAIPESADLSRVALAVQASLSYRPLVAVTPDREQARWRLGFEAEPAGVDVGEVSLTLTDRDGGGRQRLSSVFVSGLPGRPGMDAPPSTAIAGSAQAPPAVAALLSPLQMHPARPEGVCDARKARVNTCVEISFELREPAYLFVLSTRDHRVVEAPCAQLRRAEPGPRRYRLRVPPGTDALGAGGPDAGFYVLAARDRVVAARLRGVLARSPGQCRHDGRQQPPGSAGANERGRWLDDLARLLERSGDRVTWRAVQMAHDTAGVVALRDG